MTPWLAQGHKVDEEMVYRFLLASLAVQTWRWQAVSREPLVVLTLTCEKCSISFDLALPEPQVAGAMMRWMKSSSHRDHWARAKEGDRP